MNVRRPIHALAVLAALTCTALTASPAAATTWLVPGDGSGTCTTGSPNCDTIEDAVAASAATDTISIAAGSFPVPNSLALNHALTIAGAGMASTTATVTAGVIGFQIKADGIVIQDLTIQGGNVGIQFPVASDDTEITRVKLDGSTVFDMEISAGPGASVTNVAVADSTLSGSNIGLKMASISTVDGLSITGTTFIGNNYGIYQANDGGTSTLTNFTVDGCTFIDNASYHIYSEEMRNASIEDSSFTGGTVGVIIIKFYASNGLPISNVAFRRNQFTGMTGNALDLEMIAMGLGSPITIEDNTIQKSVGIQTSLPAIFLRLHPSQPNGAVNVVDNHIALTGTFGAGTSAHAVWLRGNGPVTFTGNVLDGGNVGGSGTTPPTSGIFIEARTSSGATQMPATTSIMGSCNRIQGFHNGISVWNSQASAYGGLLAGSTVSFANDAIDGNDNAGVANGATPVLNFENNWWGCVAGPGNPGCDAIVGGVDAAPNATTVPACVECAVNAECDDGLFCNGTETCNGSNQCVAGSDPCSGGSACNDVCNEAADNCVAPDGSGCDDADICTLDDVCTAGVCGGGPSCGDGVIQGGCGEICDDGNLTSNDGCSSTCQFEFVCTPTPLTGCRGSAPGKSQLQVKVKGGIKDQLQWKWSKGVTTLKADYGSPTTTTEYRLCIYGNGNLVSRETIPAAGMCAGKLCWKETKTGFNYKDKDASPDGITQLSLKQGLVDGKAKIGLKGKGINLDTPPLPLALPVTVQLRSSNGNCWETIHSTPAQRNDGAQYKDKSD